MADPAGGGSGPTSGGSRSAGRPGIARLIARSGTTVKALREAVSEVYRLRRRCRGPAPVRVLHLIETGGPGGAERMLVDLARCLGASYHSTVGLLKPGWLQSLVAGSGMPWAMLDAAGDAQVVARLLRLVRERRIDLIHAHEFYMSALAAATSRLTGVPVVTTVHGKSYYPDKPHRRAIYRMVSGSAAAVVTVSEDLRQFFCRTTGADPARVRVIYNGIDGAPFGQLQRDPALLESIRIPPAAPVVGAVGNLYPVKGHVHLIRAMPTVLRDRPDTHVIILGRGALGEPLGAEAARLGIRDRVHLVGHTDDVSRWLGAMDVFVLPSLSEGLPLSLLEAMAAGRPIVATRVGGIPEVVRDGHTGFLVPPGEPDALARHVSLLLDDPAAAARMGAAGRARMRDAFSAEKMVAAYRALYEEALAPHSFPYALADAGR